MGLMISTYTHTMYKVHNYVHNNRYTRQARGITNMANGAVEICHILTLEPILQHCNNVILLRYRRMATVFRINRSHEDDP